MHAYSNKPSAARLVRQEVVGLPVYNAGISEQFMLENYGVSNPIRLASNENPLGASPLALEAAAKNLGSIWKYSDPDSSCLRSALADSIGVDQARLVIGNGSEELIALLCRSCLRPGERCVTIDPSFLLHEIYPLEQGAVIETVPMTPELLFDITKLEEAIKVGCRMIIFSNPSNPVGAMMTAEEFSRLISVIPPETLLVVDEAYYEYASADERYPDTLKQLKSASFPYCLLRTFSKAFGIAGTRVGYGVFSDSWFAEQINKLRTPFNVNSIAQAAALAALADYQHLERTILHNQSERLRLSSRLHELGCRVAESHANFLFVKTSRKSTVIAELLLKSGIIIKPWLTKGYENFLRVTIGNKKDNTFLMKIIAENL